jgi:hypothetical protein
VKSAVPNERYGTDTLEMVALNPQGTPSSHGPPETKDSGPSHTVLEYKRSMIGTTAVT